MSASKHGDEEREQSCSLNETGGQPLLLFVPGSTQCQLDQAHEQELLTNVTQYALWKYLPIYADFIPVRDIIKMEKQKWINRFGDDALASFPRYMVINHFGAYCRFSREFFAIYFEVASAFGQNRILFVLLESLSPWYVSKKHAVSGIPDVRLYQIGHKKHTSLGQYVTSGQRSYLGFAYWLEQYTHLDERTAPKYALLLPTPTLHKRMIDNQPYYTQHYETVVTGTTYDFDAMQDKPFNRTVHLQSRFARSSNVLTLDLTQMSGHIEEQFIAYVSTALSVTLIFVTILQYLHRLCQRTAAT